jgi:ribosomal protein S18 acetylase RimI-like enzyme
VNGCRLLAIPVSRAEVHIRSAVPDDAPGIAAVLSESFAEFATLYTPEGYAATTPNADQVRQRMAEGPTWVAHLNHAMVGTVSAVQKNGDSLYVRGMAVVPSVRGQRVGETLLNAVQTFAVNNGSSRLFLSTTPFLTAAIRLYEKFGFERTTKGPQELFGTPLFTMSKELNTGHKFRSHQ